MDQRRRGRRRRDIGGVVEMRNGEAD